MSEEYTQNPLLAGALPDVPDTLYLNSIACVVRGGVNRPSGCLACRNCIWDVIRDFVIVKGEMILVSSVNVMVLAYSR